MPGYSCSVKSDTSQSTWLKRVFSGRCARRTCKPLICVSTQSAPSRCRSPQSGRGSFPEVGATTKPPLSKPRICPPLSSKAPAAHVSLAKAHDEGAGFGVPRYHGKPVYRLPQTDTSLPVFKAFEIGAAEAAGVAARFFPRARAGAGAGALELLLLLALLALLLLLLLLLGAVTTVSPRLVSTISAWHAGHEYVKPRLGFGQSLA